MPKANEVTITDTVDEFFRQQRELHAAAEGLVTFTQSVRAFIAASSWLDAEHMPSLVTLLSVAEKLDREVTAAMVAQFGVTFRDLRSQSPSATPSHDDPLEQLLAAAGK